VEALAGKKSGMCQYPPNIATSGGHQR